MKRLFLVFALLVSATYYAQAVEGTTVVACGFEEYSVVQRNTVLRFENLDVACGYNMLLQDNSIIYVENLTGTGTILRGDAGGGVFMEALGIDRRPGDENPMVVLHGFYTPDEEGQAPITVNFGPNIDVVDTRELIQD